MKQQIEHIFFDLDHTLWDFDRNSSEAIQELLHRHELVGKRGITVQLFLSIYRPINDRLWVQYREGNISKSELRARRFRDAFHRFGIHQEGLAAQFDKDYIALSPTKTHLFPGAHEVLQTLSENYRLHIITNGFKEVQDIKIKGSGLVKYFDEVITSEQAGANKPKPAIFDYAMQRTGARIENSVMIGDNMEADIKGALSVNMKAVYFNPNGVFSSEGDYISINDLRQLLHFL